MKKSLAFITVALCFSTVTLFAGPSGKSTVSETTAAVEPANLSFEFDAEQTGVGDGDVIRGNGPLALRDFYESDTKIRFILTPRTKIGILRLGAQWERYSFGFNGRSALPDVLEAENLVVGLDTEFSDSFLIRLELQPGFYGTDSTDWNSSTFNLPFILGGTYIFNPSFQVTFGVGVDAFRKYPVLPGGGIRWKFAPQWVLNAVAPTPRLEFEMTSNVTIYGGADIRATSYRVDEKFGTLRGDRRLNNGRMTFEEIRTGGGFEWKVATGLKLSLEGGVIPYRNFDFFGPHVRYHQDGAAPYGMIALRAAF